ncbi:MAG: glycosyltransferase [Solirubrobacterales bacterium]
MIDGESQLIPLVRGLDLPVAVLANPHDLFGESNHFRLTSRILSDLADVVLVGALEPSRFAGSDATPRIHIMSPAVKPMARRVDPPTRRPRVLLTLGGGSANAGDEFRVASNRISSRILEALRDIDADALGSVTYAPGHDGPAIASWSENVEVLDRHYDVVDRIASSDVVITRGGRNTIAESLAAGVGLIVIPLHDDPLRGSEQLANAKAAMRLGNATVMDCDALNAQVIADAIVELLERGKSTTSPGFAPGNTAMWDILLTRLDLAERSPRP